jgi:hypothetical protein
MWRGGSGNGSGSSPHDLDLLVLGSLLNVPRLKLNEVILLVALTPPQLMDFIQVPSNHIIICGIEDAELAREVIEEW